MKKDRELIEFKLVAKSKASTLQTTGAYKNQPELKKASMTGEQYWS